MTVRNSFAGLPAFLFGDGGLHNQLVCDVRTYVRANDGSRDLLAPMLAWSPGPPAIGDTGDNSPGHMMGTTWLLQVCPDGSWVLYREDRGRLEVVPFDDPPANVTSTARHVSLCFDQAARVALTWEDQGIIKVRRWDAEQNQYIENVSFSGVDPVVVFDAQWAYQIPSSDVLVFYLSPDRTRLLCRVQRDVYAVEHQVWDYGQPVILDRVLALPYRYQALASDASGAPLPSVLVSDLYPVPTFVRLGGDGRVAAGAYDQVAEALAHQLAVDGDGVVQAGLYEVPFSGVRHDLLLAGDGVVASGRYRNVVTTYEQTVAVAGDGVIHSGAYPQVATPLVHAVTLEGDGQIVGGTYATP